MQLCLVILATYPGSLRRTIQVHQFHVSNILLPDHPYVIIQHLLFDYRELKLLSSENGISKSYLHEWFRFDISLDF